MDIKNQDKEDSFFMTDQIITHKIFLEKTKHFEIFSKSSFLDKLIKTNY